MEMGQDECRQRDIDDEGVERRVPVIRHSLRLAQDHADQQADHENRDIRHGTGVLLGLAAEADLYTRSPNDLIANRFVQL